MRTKVISIGLKGNVGILHGSRATPGEVYYGRSAIFKLQYHIIGFIAFPNRVI